MSYNIGSDVAVLFARSASKHGITEAQVEFVVAHCGLVFDEPAPVGSMTLRSKYRERYVEALARRKLA